MRRAVDAAVVLLYPLAIFFGYGRVDARILAGVLALVGLIRYATTTGPFRRAALAAALALAAAVVVFDRALPLKLYPLVVSGVLLAFFGWSLVSPPTVAERLARLRDPELSPAGVRYTRHVTEVWCVFFVLNMGISLATALWGSLAAWSLYNGVIAYVLMALLFAGEYLVRRRVMRVAHG